jgi:hypothetical protein
MLTFGSFLLVFPALVAGSLLGCDAPAEDTAGTPIVIENTSAYARAEAVHHRPNQRPSQASDAMLVAAPSTTIAPAMTPRTTSVTSTSSSTSTTSTVQSTTSTSTSIVLDYTTTKWYESWVGGTYSTWFPTVITVIHKEPLPPPPPGKGEIGLGSITGLTGQTQTVEVGAAPSQTAAWMKGVAAAAGVGLAGMVL